jgi:predicted nucleic acid-binding protein
MAALDTRQRFQLSYWDSAIIEASRAMGSPEVLSEDLGDSADEQPVAEPGCILQALTFP